MFPRIREWCCTAIAFAIFIAPAFMAGQESQDDSQTPTISYVIER